MIGTLHAPSVNISERHNKVASHKQCLIILIDLCVCLRAADVVNSSCLCRKEAKYFLLEIKKTYNRVLLCGMYSDGKQW